MATSIANIAISEPIHPNEKEKSGDSSSIVNGEDSVAISASMDENVVFEDYLFFAAVQRREEDGLKPGEPVAETTKKKNRLFNWFLRLSRHKGQNVDVDVSKVIVPSMTEEQQERANASKALRLASWASIFYLITTDILGPFNAPFAISQVGWVPGAYLRFC